MSRKPLLFAGSAVVASVVVATALSAQLFGTRAEHYIRTVVEQGAAGVPATVSRYDRSWFSSEFDITVQLPTEPVRAVLADPDSYEDDTVPAVFSHRVYHGPVLFGSDGPRLGLARVEASYRQLPVPQALLAPPFRDAPPINIHAHVRFDERIKVRFDAQETEWQTDQGTVHHGGLNGAFDLDEAAGRVTGQVTVAGVEVINRNGGILALEPLVFSADLTRALPDIWLGTGELTVDELFANTDDRSLTLAKLSMVSTAERDDRRPAFMRQSTDLRVEAIAWEADGERSDLGPAMVSMRASGLDMAALQSMQQANRALQLAIIGQRAPSPRDQQRLAEAFEAVLAGGPTLEIADGRVPTTLGAATFDQSVRMAPGFAYRLSQPRSIITGLSAGGQLRMDGPLAQWLAEEWVLSQSEAGRQDVDEATLTALGQTLIGEFVDQGYLRRDGDAVIVTHRVDRGRVFVGETEIYDLTTALGG